MESHDKLKGHPTNDEGKGSRGLDTEVADRTVSPERPAHESLHESSQITSETPIALAERSRSTPINTYLQAKAEQRDEDSADAKSEVGEDVPFLVPDTSSESNPIPSRQGRIIEEVDEDMDDAERDSQDTGEENEETRSEGTEDIEKRKSGSRGWDKVVAQTDPDFVREQQDHDAGNQSRREDNFASHHSESNPGDDQLGADVCDDDEAASVSTIDSKSVCLDHNDPAYDEEKAIEIAKAASLATPEPKIQLGRYQCPDIRRQFPSILAEFMSLPDEKKRDRKAHLDGMEKRWQAQEQERRENGPWTRFGISREHFFDIFKTRQAWKEALDAVEEWNNDGWCSEEGDEIGDNQNARRDGKYEGSHQATDDLTESEKDAIEKAEIDMAIADTLGALIEENYDPGTSGVGLSTRPSSVPSPEDLDRDSRRSISSDRNEDTRRRAGDDDRDAERNDARSYSGGSSSAKKYGNGRDTGEADNGSGDHDEEGGKMNHQTGDGFHEEPTGTREHEDGNDNDEDENEIVESGGEGFQDDPDSNDDFDHESTCSSFLDGVIPLTNEAVTGDVAADIEDKRLKVERFAEWKATFEEEESISEEIPGVSEADKLEHNPSLKQFEAARTSGGTDDNDHSASQPETESESHRNTTSSTSSDGTSTVDLHKIAPLALSDEKSDVEGRGSDNTGQDKARKHAAITDKERGQGSDVKGKGKQTEQADQTGQILEGDADARRRQKNREARKRKKEAKKRRKAEENRQDSGLSTAQSSAAGLRQNAVPRQEHQGVPATQPYSTLQDENNSEQSQNDHAINETTEEQVHGIMDGNDAKAASSTPSESAAPRPIDADDAGGSRADLSKAVPGDDNERDGEETKAAMKDGKA